LGTKVYKKLDAQAFLLKSIKIFIKKRPSEKQTARAICVKY
jgi:hypothetical protein